MNPNNLRPTVFLDRDGVLIHEKHYLSDLKDIQVYDDVPLALSKLKAAGFLLIMVTNQSGVARGYFDEDFVKAAYDHIQNLLLKQHATLDSMFYCPHHKKGNAPFNIDCRCRKPAPGMILDANKKYGIDLKRSYMIGDKLCDVELAKNSGVTGIILQTGHGKEHAPIVKNKYPDVKACKKFAEATNFILGKSS